MDNVLEQQRKLHEERERLEDAIAKESLLKKGTVRDHCCIGLCVPGVEAGMWIYCLRAWVASVKEDGLLVTRL